MQRATRVPASSPTAPGDDTSGGAPPTTAWRVVVRRAAWWLLVVGLAACQPDAAFQPGPRLVAERTLAPVTLTATPGPTDPNATPSPTRVIIATVEGRTIAVPTVPRASATPTATITRTPRPTRVLFPTPTLIPSRTPLPTATPAPTLTLPPLGLPTRALDPFAAPLPTFAVAGGGPVFGAPAPGTPCAFPWFFASVSVPGCPSGPVLEGPGALQRFERGWLVWTGTDGRIYALYDAAAFPRWRMIQDSWNEALPDSDPAFAPPPGLTQPRRGFGLAWRTFEDVRARLGWAVAPEETPYRAQVQTGPDGTIYLLGFFDQVLALAPRFDDWRVVR